MAASFCKGVRFIDAIDLRDASRDHEGCSAERKAAFATVRSSEGLGVHRFDRGRLGELFKIAAGMDSLSPSLNDERSSF